MLGDQDEEAFWRDEMKTDAAIEFAPIILDSPFEFMEFQYELIKKLGCVALRYTDTIELEDDDIMHDWEIVKRSFTYFKSYYGIDDKECD